MSWLKTLVEVADVAVTAKNAYDIHQIKKSQEQAAAVGVIQQYISASILELNDTFETLKLARRRRPIAVATGILYLESTVEERDMVAISQQAGLRSGDLQLLNKTVRDMRETRDELMRMMSPEQQRLVAVAAASMRKYDEIAFVIQGYNQRTQHRSLRAQLQDLNRKTPSMFSSGPDRREWNEQKRRTMEAMKVLEEHLTEAKEAWESLVKGYAGQSQGQLQEQANKMDALLQHVFGQEQELRYKLQGPSATSASRTRVQQLLSGI